MEIRGLGLRTELFFWGLGGEVRAYDHHMVVRTPDQPDYFWGNLLILPDAPDVGDEARWPELFAREIGSEPDVRHMVFQWDTVDGSPGAADRFVPLGFSLDRSEVLSTRTPCTAPRRNPAIEVRELRSDADWHALLELSVLCRDPAYSEDLFREFITARQRTYRRWTQAGHGDWYGAFLEDRLVADLGLFDTGGGLGRFQAVETHPELRRRGICATLVSEVSRRALESGVFHELVMVAQEDDAHGAGRVYRSVGYRPIERMAALTRFPEEWSPSAAP